MNIDKCNKKLHGKFWIGKFGYFWADGKNTLYCHCSKCDRFFNIGVDLKYFKYGEPIHKGVTIDYDRA